MRMSIPSISELVAWLTGTGAMRNARGEVVNASAKVADLESQLQQVVDPTPRRAA